MQKKKKKTRIVLNAYGSYGEESEPLVPGEDVPPPPDLDSWRTSSNSSQYLPRHHNQYQYHATSSTTDPPSSTGIRYRNGLPEYSVRSFFRHLNFAVPSRWDVVEITDTGVESMLSYRHIGELLQQHRDLPVSAPGLRRLQLGRPSRRRFFLFLTEPDTSVASAVFFFILIISIFILNIVSKYPC